MRTCAWFVGLGGVLTLSAALAASPERKPVEDDGTVHVPAFDLPFSELASPEMREQFVEGGRRFRAIVEEIQRDHLDNNKTLDAKHFAPLIAKLNARYAVDVQPKEIGGVYTEIFTPREGVPARKKSRVLINLHGGGFVSGARAGGRVESIPIAGVGKFEVISVDYRQGPTYHFPAANEDVAKVYRELIKTHRPENVGIYGCSAGGVLTAQLIGWFRKNNLPRPGAIGVFGAGAESGVMGTTVGESAYVGRAARGYPIPAGPLQPASSLADYYAGADQNDPLVNPILSPALLKAFPPTLLINGLQDVNWSATIYTHNQLVKTGVDARLHLWEGGNHCFLFDPDVPESREAYDVIVKFFDTRLGK